MTMVQQRLTNGQKLDIVQDSVTRTANGESIKSVARSHGVQPCQIWKWRAQLQQLAQTQKGKKSVGKGRASRLQDKEDLIMGWALHQRDAGFPLTCRHLVLKGSELCQEFRELKFCTQHHDE